MTRTLITPITITSPASNGYNLTDSTDFETMATGVGSGVSFTYDSKDLVVVKAPTGSAAAFTLVLPTLTRVTAVGGSVTNPTVAVAAGKTHVLQLSSVVKQTNGKVYIDCDVAAEIMVLNVT